MAGENRKVAASVILGLFLFGGLLGLGYQLSNSFLQVKMLERTVEVKGLAEREVPADTVIWPISFNSADNDLTFLYQTVQEKTPR